MGLKEAALTFGIAVLFALFAGFTIDAVKPAPDYAVFCNETMYDYQKPYDVKSNCTDVYSSELAFNCTKQKGTVRTVFRSGCPALEGCDFCQLSFEDANKNYNLMLLWVTAIIGIVAIIVGMYTPMSYDPIASGFIFGGVLTIFYGTVRAFSELSRIPRAIILGVELVLLIWLGIKKILHLPKNNQKLVSKKKK